MHGHFDIAEMLREHGAALDTPNNKGVTPLMFAAQHNHVTIVNSLLRAGAAVNSRDDFGRTPLMFAAMGGSQDCVQALLDHRASKSDKDSVCARICGVCRCITASMENRGASLAAPRVYCAEAVARLMATSEGLLCCAVVCWFRVPQETHTAYDWAVSKGFGDSLGPLLATHRLACSK